MDINGRLQSMGASTWTHDAKCADAAVWSLDETYCQRHVESVTAARELRQLLDHQKEQENRVHAEESQSSVSAPTVTRQMSSPSTCTLGHGIKSWRFRESSETSSSSSQPKNLPDAPARVRLQHSPIESHEEHSKRRRVIESSDRDEVTAMHFKWIQRLRLFDQTFHTIIWCLESERPQGKVKGLHSQNDFLRMRGVPSADVNKKSKAEW